MINSLRSRSNEWTTLGGTTHRSSSLPSTFTMPGRESQPGIVAVTDESMRPPDRRHLQNPVRPLLSGRTLSSSVCSARVTAGSVLPRFHQGDAQRPLLVRLAVLHCFHPRRRIKQRSSSSTEPTSVWVRVSQFEYWRCAAHYTFKPLGSSTRNIGSVAMASPFSPGDNNGVRGAQQGTSLARSGRMNNRLRDADQSECLFLRANGSQPFGRSHPDDGCLFPINTAIDRTPTRRTSRGNCFNSFPSR